MALRKKKAKWLVKLLKVIFVESYKMLYSDNKDILEEFISRVEKTLSEDTARDKLMKYQKSADNLQSKRKTLLEKYLEGVVSQDIYEETDVGYERKLSNIRANIEMLEQQMECFYCLSICWHQVLLLTGWYQKIMYIKAVMLKAGV